MCYLGAIMAPMTSQKVVTTSSEVLQWLGQEGKGEYAAIAQVVYNRSQKGKRGRERGGGGGGGVGLGAFDKCLWAMHSHLTQRRSSCCRSLQRQERCTDLPICFEAALMKAPKVFLDAHHYHRPLLHPYKHWRHDSTCTQALEFESTRDGQYAVNLPKQLCDKVLHDVWQDLIANCPHHCKRFIKWDIRPNQASLFGHR